MIFDMNIVGEIAMEEELELFHLIAANMKN